MCSTIGIELIREQDGADCTCQFTTATPRNGNTGARLKLHLPSNDAAVRAQHGEHTRQEVQYYFVGAPLLIDPICNSGEQLLAREGCRSLLMPEWEFSTNLFAVSDRLRAEMSGLHCKL